MYKPLDDLVNNLGGYIVPNAPNEFDNFAFHELVKKIRLKALEQFFITELSQITGKDEESLKIEYEKILFELLGPAASKFLMKRGIVPDSFHF